MSDREAALQKPSRPSGPVLHFSLPTPVCQSQEVLPVLHRCMQTHSKGCEGAVHSLLVSTLPVSSSLLLPSSLVLSASSHERTPHVGSKNHAVQLVSPMGFFPALRTGNHLTQDSQGKDVGIKLLTGHENATNDHFVFSSNMWTYSQLFCIFKLTF